jgi:hypothetical protein
MGGIDVRLLKTVLLSTTLMMGATFGSAADLTSGQPSAVNQGEVSAVFAKAQAAFTFNQKLVKGKLLEFLGRYIPEFAHTETVDSSSVKVLTALKGAFELTVQAKTAAETDLATARGRVQEVEGAAAAVVTQKAQAESNLATFRLGIDRANAEKTAAEEVTRKAAAEKTAVEKTLAGAQVAAQRADEDSQTVIEQLKAQLQEEEVKSARLQQRVLESRRAAAEKVAAAREAAEKAVREAAEKAVREAAEKAAREAAEKAAREAAEKTAREAAEKAAREAAEKAAREAAEKTAVIEAAGAAALADVEGLAEL